MNIKNKILPAIIFAFLLIYSAEAWATDTDLAPLIKELETLKKKIEEIEPLKARVAELEKQLAKAREKANKPTVPKQNVASTITRVKKDITIGGALRTNIALKDYSESSKSKKGDWHYDMARLDVNGTHNDFLISLQYRWYSYMDVIHHGWIGYKFNNIWQVQFGVTQVPFGLLPYASHSFWMGVPYYMGMEDDYDMGAKVIYKTKQWDLQLAFFKNEEWGDSTKKERYSFDVIRALDQDNEETNQFNARLAYVFQHGNNNRTELGISGELGQIYNHSTDKSGSHWAVAAHVNSFWGRWNLQMEAARYRYDPKNPYGVDDEVVVMGAFNDAFPVVAKGTVLLANIAYELPAKLGPISKLTFYNDYSVLIKDRNSFDNCHINTLGCLISANPVYLYIDLILGKNMIWLGGPQDAMGRSVGSHADWSTRFNINITYYF
jgi:hypothetical protein